MSRMNVAIGLERGAGTVARKRGVDLRLNEPGERTRTCGAHRRRMKLRERLMRSFRGESSAGCIRGCAREMWSHSNIMYEAGHGRDAARVAAAGAFVY